MRSRTHETVTARRKTCDLTLFPRACVAQRGCLTRLLPVQIIKLIQAQAIAAGKAAEDKAAAKQAAAEQAAAEQAAAAAERAALEAELQQLTVKQLRLRAKVEGVDDDALEDARDGDTPKASIIELILANILLEGLARQQSLEQGTRVMQHGANTPTVARP